MSNNRKRVPIGLLTIVCGCALTIFILHGPQLHDAIETGDLEKVTTLLRDATNLAQTLEEEDDAGKTPLIVAIEEGSENIVKLLIKYGANVNARATKGTPLAAAIFNMYNQNKEIIVFLLHNGAFIDTYHMIRQYKNVWHNIKPLFLRASTKEVLDYLVKYPVFLNLDELKKYDANVVEFFNWYAQGAKLHNIPKNSLKTFAQYILTFNGFDTDIWYDILKQIDSIFDLNEICSNEVINWAVCFGQHGESKILTLLDYLYTLHDSILREKIIQRIKNAAYTCNNSTIKSALLGKTLKDSGSKDACITYC